ncbi:MAG: IS21-like element helper ATPase IstB [Sporichthyaceae bacterium]|nr:IS21-like element helper ATPase IstB [Sporichthyaceae bacterium]
MTTATRAARAPRARAAAPGVDPTEAAIDLACRALQLPTIRQRYDEIAATALREQSSYKHFLADLLAAEVAERGERRKLRLVHEAGFARPKRLEDLDYTANPAISAEVINTLADPAWVRAGAPLVLLGDSGTGKSHLLIGIGTAIAEAGLKVRYSTCANLVNELVEAADEHHLSRSIARYGKVDLLCLDEFGYLELDPAGAKLLFQIFTEREERRAIAVASNAPFSEWKRTFTDPRLCAAIVDRLTFNGHIIETGTSSYRLATTRAKRQPR